MDQREVVPLVDNISHLVIDALHAHASSRQIRGFVAWYQASLGYQRALALGMRKRDHHGNRIGYVSQDERNAARQWLLDQGRWGSALAKMFNQNLCLHQ